MTSDFHKAISRYKNSISLNQPHAYRGQANSCWNLDPSLKRLTDKKKLKLVNILIMEQQAVRKFGVTAKYLLPNEKTTDLHIPEYIPFAHDISEEPQKYKINMQNLIEDGITEEKLNWYMIMQQFSAPTRLLDWSLSPWVALYFACNDLSQNDGAVWIYSGNDVTAPLKNQEKNEVRFIPPTIANERVEAQQGIFSFCNDPMTSHDDFLYKTNNLEKIVIPSEDKEKYMVELQGMKINARTLFPGIDGLGKSIYEFWNLWDGNRFNFFIPLETTE